MVCGFVSEVLVVKKLRAGPSVARSGSGLRSCYKSAKIFPLSFFPRQVFQYTGGMEKSSLTKEEALKSLGTLSKLPGEIRNIIYEELRPYLRPYTERLSKSSPHEVVKGAHGALGLLLASRQLNREATTYLYDEETIRFRINSDPKFWLTIDNGRGANWNVQTFGDAISNIFTNLPYEKLKGIRVSIRAPYARDTSNDIRVLCRLSQNIRSFVRLLEPHKSLAPLHIELTDRNPRCHWTYDCDSPRQTWFGRSYEKDYMVALLPFCALENISRVTISGAHLEGQAHILDNVRQVLERNMPFMALVGEEDYWVDGNNIRDWTICVWNRRTVAYC